MGRKKKKTVKPWCWYCNREFEDDKVLAFHQKAKHFKCHICYKKLFSAPGLAIHCSQVHKETVSTVPNALPGRDNIEVEIFGMEGIPEADRIAHELQKTGRADVEEPETKRLKMMAAAGFVPPGMIYPAPVMPGMVPPPGIQVMPGMVPPPMGGPPPIPQPIRPPPVGPPPPPSQPLFPGGVQPPPGPVRPPIPPGGPPDAPPKPAFPAYQNSEPAAPGPTPAAPPPKQTSKVPPVGEGCKLIHPDDDLSMEELRSQLPKYKNTTVARDAGNPAPPPPMPPAPFAGGPPVIRPGMGPVMIRPGMGPPPPGFHPPILAPT